MRESQSWIIHKTLKNSHYEWKKLVTFAEKFRLFHILQEIKNTEGYVITLLKLLAEIDCWTPQAQYLFVKKNPTTTTPPSAPSQKTQNTWQNAERLYELMVVYPNLQVYRWSFSTVIKEQQAVIVKVSYNPRLMHKDYTSWILLRWKGFTWQ